MQRQETCRMATDTIKLLHEGEHCKHECHLMFTKCLMMQCILTVGPPHELHLGMCLPLFIHE